MEQPSDLFFLKIQGFTDNGLPITEVREHAVRFDEDGTPNWPNMLKVTDCILFLFDVVDFFANEKHDLVEFWVPYNFRDSLHGNCCVRVWPKDGPESLR